MLEIEAILGTISGEKRDKRILLDLQEGTQNRPEMQTLHSRLGGPAERRRQKRQQMRL